MKIINLRGHLRAALILVLLALIWGCGSGGGSTPNIVDSNKAAGTVIPLGNGTFVIQINAMNYVAGMELDATYDSSSLGTPSVSQGTLTLASGATLVDNTNTPGIIKIAIVWAIPISGNGRLAIVSFASHDGTGSFTVIANMVDAKGASLGSWSSTANDF